MKGRDAVITSANLSTYALGAGEQKEIGILLPSSNINIDKIIKSIKAKPYTINKLNALEKDQIRIRRQIPEFIPQKSQENSFDKWYKNKHPRPWRMANWSPANIRLSQEGKKTIEANHGSSAFQDIMGACRGDYEQDDWILCFQTNDGKPYQISWMYAHYLIKVSPKDKAYSKNNPF